MEPTPQPGWYPDEDNPERLRYWDGSSWTDRTRQRQATGQDPGKPASPRRRWLPLGLAGAALVAIAAVVGVFVLGGSEEAKAEVILQPTASDGVDPFTDSIANERVNQLTSNGADLAGDPVEGISGGDATIESITGSAPGLYGGTEKETVCDPAAMVEFLEQNPEEAAAWAGALGIEVRQIEKYVSTLTPVLLREDTRVTNNGFAGGAATPFQAVLQAGTAVLADENGVPRVRCACGNPLGEAEPAEGDPELTGESWEGLDENRLVAVTPSDETIETYELVDVETGRTFEQPAGSGGLTVDELINLKVPETCLPSAPLSDGIHPADETTGDQGGILSVQVPGAPGGFFEGPLEAAVGDLTGDGAADGAMIIRTRCGGSAAFIDFVYGFDSSGVFLGDIGHVAQAAEPGGIILSYSNIRIVDGRLEVDTAEVGADDALVEGATIESSLVFEWRRSHFVPVGTASSPGGGESESSGSSPGDGSGGGSASIPAGAEDCGGGVFAGEVTSCEFALNVADEYESSGGQGSISVFSPVTDQTYEMSCTSGSPHVCTGGNDAAVYFP